MSYKVFDSVNKETEWLWRPKLQVHYTSKNIKQATILASSDTQTSILLLLLLLLLLIIIIIITSLPIEISISGFKTSNTSEFHSVTLNIVY